MLAVAFGELCGSNAGLGGTISSPDKDLTARASTFRDRFLSTLPLSEADLSCLRVRVGEPTHIAHPPPHAPTMSPADRLSPFLSSYCVCDTRTQPEPRPHTHTFQATTPSAYPAEMESRITTEIEAPIKMRTRHSLPLLLSTSCAMPRAESPPQS